MVIKRSSSSEVARLVDALLTSDPIAREAAAARLAIVGPRALERLTAVLQAQDQPTAVVALLDVMDRIGDPRSAATAAPYLQHPDDAVAMAAVAVTRLALKADPTDAATRATDALIAVATSPAASPQVKRAAVEALGELPEDVVAAIRARLGSVATAAEGPPAIDPVAPACSLEQFAVPGGEHAGPREVHEALQAEGATAPVTLLHRLVTRLREVERTSVDERAHEWRLLRGLAHQRLAERGSLVALYDLRETLEQGPADPPVSMLAALQIIGDASCVEPVAEAWERTHDAWVRGQLRDGLLAIVQRERLTRRHAALKRLATRHPALLREISTPSQTRP